MRPFQSSGERARWRIIYDVLAAMSPGDVLTYDRCAELLDLDPLQDRGLIQSAVRDAQRRNEVDNKSAIEAVPNVGYRVVEAIEHARLAKNYQRRSEVAISSGKSKVVNVDMSGLDHDTRHMFELMALAFSRQEDINRKFDVRQRKLESALAAVSQKTDRSADEVAQLRARLEALEARPS